VRTMTKNETEWLIMYRSPSVLAIHCPDFHKFLFLFLQAPLSTLEGTPSLHPCYLGLVSHTKNFIAEFRSC